MFKFFQFHKCSKAPQHLIRFKLLTVAKKLGEPNSEWKNLTKSNKIVNKVRDRSFCLRSGTRIERNCFG